MAKVERIPECHPERKHYCKGLCCACYGKRSYLKHREKRLAFQREWREQNPEAYREWQKANPEYNKLYLRGYSTAEFRMFHSAKARAKKKGIVFDLEPSDIIVPEFCPALGIKLERARPSLCTGTQPGRTKYSDFSPSLDRIVPELGYVKGNVWVISLKANRIKNTATPDELQKIADAVIKRLTAP
jgi:hypothetical protein